MKWADYWNYLTLGVWGSYTNPIEWKRIKDFLTVDGLKMIPQPVTNINPYKITYKDKDLACQLIEMNRGTPKNAIKSKKTGIFYPTTRRRAKFSMVVDGENGNMPYAFDKIMTGRFPNHEPELIKLISKDMSTWEGGYYLIRVKIKNVRQQYIYEEAKIALGMTKKKFEAGIKTSPDFKIQDAVHEMAAEQRSRRWNYFSLRKVKPDKSNFSLPWGMRNANLEVKDANSLLDEALKVNPNIGEDYSFLWIHIDKNKKGDLRDIHIVEQYLESPEVDTELYSIVTQDLIMSGPEFKKAFKELYCFKGQSIDPNSPSIAEKKFDELLDSKKVGEVITDAELDTIRPYTMRTGANPVEFGKVSLRAEIIDENGNVVPHCGNLMIEQDYIAPTGNSKLFDKDGKWIPDEMTMQLEFNKNFLQPKQSQYAVGGRLKTLSVPMYDDDSIIKRKMFNLMETRTMPRCKTVLNRTSLSGRGVVGNDRWLIGNTLRGGGTQNYGGWNEDDMQGNKRAFGVVIDNTQDIKPINSDKDAKKGIVFISNYNGTYGVLENNNLFTIPPNQTEIYNLSGKTDVYEANLDVRTDWYYNPDGFQLASIPSANFSSFINWSSGFNRIVWEFLNQ